MLEKRETEDMGDLKERKTEGENKRKKPQPGSSKTPPVPDTATQNTDIKKTGADHHHKMTIVSAKQKGSELKQPSSQVISLISFVI